MGMYADLINDIKAGGEARLKSFGQSILSALKAIGVDLAGGKIAVSAPVTPKATTASADTSKLEERIETLEGELEKVKIALRTTIEQFNEKIVELEGRIDKPSEVKDEEVEEEQPPSSRRGSSSKRRKPPVDNS